MAIACHGGTDWIDLSTGINRVPYPLPPVPAAAWTELPTRTEMAGLIAAARSAYRTSAAITAAAGAQTAIQLIPRLATPGRARILQPTYNEHAAALVACGWTVEPVATLGALAGAELAVVVNPNNPDGQTFAPAALLSVAGSVGRLVVDESFTDARPQLSLASSIGGGGSILVLRSFGKFYGLAGVRLGFVIGPDEDIGRLADMSGPWPVSGAAIAIGRQALGDTVWRDATIARLRLDAERLDGLAAATGWSLVGGTELFRLYDTPSALDAQSLLARRQIWSRRFPYSDRWLRLGLPGSPLEWERLDQALGD